MKQMAKFLMHYFLHNKDKIFLQNTKRTRRCTLYRKLVYKIMQIYIYKFHVVVGFL